MKKPKPLEIFFDNRAGTYWLKIESGKFLNLDGRNVKLHLMRSQFHVEPKDDFGLKDGDRVLTTAQIERNVDYAGPLSGHGIGTFGTAGGLRVLVTAESRPMEAKRGRMPHVESFLDQLFGGDQCEVVLYWLKFARESLLRRDFRPGQLLVLAGPSACGKSLFQALVTVFLGGRSAKPYRYMIGETAFNSDLAAAEHLVIEDENASADIRSRRKFGASIKEFTVNTEISVHAKGRQAISLPTYKRMTLSVNDEPENLMILPPMDASLLDKVTLLKCSRAELSENRAENWKNLTGDLPALAYYLDSLKVPKKAKDARFGVRSYHHPEILEVLTALAPEQRLLNLIDEVLFKGQPKEKDNGATWMGTAEELEKTLRDSPFAWAVEKLLYFSSACGVYLARLEAKHPGRFTSSRLNGRTRWTITEGKTDE